MIPHFTVLGHGHTVLMLHGLMGNHLSFAPQVETLATSGYRAVAWDMPGYGRSALVEPYNVKGLAQACAHLVEALGGRAVSVVGQGLGGMVAQELALRRPELVRRLVVCGATAGAAADPSAASPWAQPLAQLEQGRSMSELADTWIPRWVGPGSLPEGVRLAHACMANVSERALSWAAAASDAFDRRAALAHLNVPSLWLAGQHDPFAPPPVVRALAAQAPRSTFLELRGVGAFHNLEAPDDFDGMLLNFLSLPQHLH